MQFSKLTSAQKLTLRARLEELSAALSGNITIATGCSGTDLVVYALQDILDDWADVFGFRCDVTELFACENMPFKQLFLEKTVAPPIIFPDLSLLAAKTVVGCDGKDHLVQSPFMWWCGVECDSISHLNAKRAENFDCIEEGADKFGKRTRTGDAGHACMAFIEVHAPTVFVLECVKNLAATGRSGKSNLDIIMRRANARGYLLICRALNCIDYGLPQSRDRFYMVGVRVSEGPVLQNDENFVMPSWVAEFHRIVDCTRVSTIPLSRFLLEDDDEQPMAANTAMECPAGESSRPPKKPRRTAVLDPEVEFEKAVAGNKVEEYKVEHLNAYYAHNLPWPPTYDVDFLMKTEACTERQKQVLWLVEKTHGLAASLSSIVVRDLHMSQEWATDRVECVPCIASSSTLWARGPRKPLAPPGERAVIDRFLCGAELLMLQGLSYERQPAEEFSNSDLTDLAGNAFNASVIYPLLTALFCTAPLIEAMSLSKGTPPESAFERPALQLDEREVPDQDEEGDVGDEAVDDASAASEEGETVDEEDVEAEGAEGHDIEFDESGDDGK